MTSLGIEYESSDEDSPNRLLEHRSNVASTTPVVAAPEVSIDV